MFSLLLLQAVIFKLTLATVYPYIAVGPYRDSNDRNLRYGPHAYGYNNDTCYLACIAENDNYTLFALQDHGWCCCDYDWHHATRDGKSNCGYEGGGWCNYIYVVNGTTWQPTTQPTIPTTQPTIQPTLGTTYPYTAVGPYKDSSDRNLRYGPHEYGYTNDSCFFACIAENPYYTVFALQNGGWCCCDYDYYHAIRDGESNCGYTGGGWCNYIYKINGTWSICEYDYDDNDTLFMWEIYGGNHIDTNKDKDKEHKNSEIFSAFEWIVLVFLFIICCLLCFIVVLCLRNRTKQAENNEMELNKVTNRRRINNSLPNYHEQEGAEGA